MHSSPNLQRSKPFKTERDIEVTVLYVRHLLSPNTHNRKCVIIRIRFKSDTINFY